MNHKYDFKFTNSITFVKFGVHLPCFWFTKAQDLTSHPSNCGEGSEVPLSSTAALKTSRIAQKQPTRKLYMAGCDSLTDFTKPISITTKLLQLGCCC